MGEQMQDQVVEGKFRPKGYDCNDCQGDQVVNDQGVCACPDGQVDDGQGNGNCIAGSTCEPFSQAACIASAISIGYQIGTVKNSGYSFAGDFGTKGCYAYSTGEYMGLVFFGTGGSKEQMQDQVVEGKFRPNGYDCNDHANCQNANDGFLPAVTGKSGKCYRFSTTKNNKYWNDAKAKCEELGGKLVEPRSKEENDEMIEEANKAWSSYAY